MSRTSPSCTPIPAARRAVAVAVAMAAALLGCHGRAHSQPLTSAPLAGEVVTFASGQVTLHGVLHRPAGPGPFPAVVYNHGSAPGMLSAQAADVLGPVFVARGWVFFMPFRRGQALSADAGPYVMDEIQRARRSGGMSAASATMVRLLTTD